MTDIIVLDQVPPNPPDMSSNEFTEKRGSSSRVRQFFEFAEISGIPGLAFIRPDTSWVETAFWLIVTLVASVLTIRDLAAQIRQFQEEPIMTTSRFVDDPGRGEGFSFPTPTLCLEINPHQLDHWIRGFENGSRLNEIFSRLSEEFHQNPNESVRCLLQPPTNSTTNIDECAKSIQSTEEYFGLLGYSMMTIMSLVRTYSKRSSIPEEVLQRNAESEWATLFLLPFNVEKQSRIVDTYLHYMHMKVPLLHLLRSVASALCSQMNVLVRFVQIGIDSKFANTTVLPDICAPEAITWLGFPPEDGAPDMLCLRLPPLTFKTRKDYVLVTLNVRRVFEPRGVFDIAKIGSMYVALPGKYETIGSPTPRTFEVFYARRAAAFLGVQTKFSQHSRARALCGNPAIDDPRSILPYCRHFCTLEFYLSNCNCWSIPGPALRDESPELQEKYRNISSICGEVSAEVAERQYGRVKIPHFSDRRCADALRQQDVGGRECIMRCLWPCARTMFQATIYEMPPMFSGINFHADDAAVVFAMKKFDYISIEEEPRLEWSNVMTNIGGIFGLWLGACFVTIAYIPVYAIKLMWLTCCTKSRIS